MASNPAAMLVLGTAALLGGSVWHTELALTLPASGMTGGGRHFPDAGDTGSMAWACARCSAWSSVAVPSLTLGFCPGRRAALPLRGLGAVCGDGELMGGLEPGELWPPRTRYSPSARAPLPHPLALPATCARLALCAIGNASPLLVLLCLPQLPRDTRGPSPTIQGQAH